MNLIILKKIIGHVNFYLNTFYVEYEVETIIINFYYNFLRKLKDNSIRYFVIKCSHVWSAVAEVAGKAFWGNGVRKIAYIYILVLKIIFGISAMMHFFGNKFRIVHQKYTFPSIKLISCVNQTNFSVHIITIHLPLNFKHYIADNNKKGIWFIYFF